jgi:hypothetical protein
MSDQDGAHAEKHVADAVGATAGVGASRSEAIANLAMGLFGGLPPGGGKFTFNAEQLTDEIKKWSQLLDDLKEDARIALPMTMVKPAGSPLDKPGQGYTDTINASGQAYLRSNKQSQDFVSDYIQKLTAVRDGHVQTERANTDDLKKKGEGL